MSASLPKLASVLLIVEIAKEKEKEGQLLSQACYNYRTTKKKKLTGFCIASLSLDLCFFRGNDFCACSLRGFLLRIRCFRTDFDPLLIQKRLIGQYSTFFSISVRTAPNGKRTERSRSNVLQHRCTCYRKNNYDWSEFTVLQHRCAFYRKNNFDWSEFTVLQRPFVVLLEE